MANEATYPLVFKDFHAKYGKLQKNMVITKVTEIIKNYNCNWYLSVYSVRFRRSCATERKWKNKV